MNQQSMSWNIEVNVAANGYIVRPASARHNDLCTPMSEFQVFESFDALTAHLRNVLPIYPAFSGLNFTATTVPKRKR